MSVLRSRKGFPSAGLIAGPAAWAISTQANYALAPVTCGRSALIVAALAAVLAIVALAGAALSWRAWQPKLESVSGERSGDPHVFVAGLGVIAGVLFALVIVMQGAAALMLNGCLR